MIRVATAQALVRANCLSGQNEAIAVEQSLGRYLADDLRSPVNLPPFTNSAMDGFALRCARDSIAAGTEFVVRGEQAAGDDSFDADGDGVWEIMTGARVPDGLDAVIPVERVSLLEQAADGRALRIRLEQEVNAGQHVRRAGEDIGEDTMVMSAGTMLGAQHLMVLASLSIADVLVWRRPQAAILCTGRELVDDPAQVLQGGQIRNANGPFLRQRLRAAGAEVVAYRTVNDDPEKFRVALAEALAAGAEMIISTGAVSMGRYDFLPDALQQMGAQILFHKVAMRPGKPLLCARLPGGQLYFGLPGNPMACAVGQRFFVETALHAQFELPAEHGWRLPLAHDSFKRPGLRTFLKARLKLDHAGSLSVELLADQESFKIRPLLSAAVWAVLPEDAQELAAGTLVEVYSLGHEMGVELGMQSDRVA